MQYIFLLGVDKHLEPIWIELIKSRLVARNNRNMVVNCLFINMIIVQLLINVYVNIVD